MLDVNHSLTESEIQPSNSNQMLSENTIMNQSASSALKMMKSEEVFTLKHWLKSALKQNDASKKSKDDRDSLKKVNLIVLEYSDQILQQMTAKLSKNVSRILKEKVSAHQHSSENVSVKEFISSQSVSKKCKRSIIEQVKIKVSDQNWDISKNQQKTDQKLITLVCIKTKTDQYLTALYCFNWREMLYKKYWHLMNMMNSNESKCLNNEVFKKLIDNLKWWKKRNENSDLFKAKGIRIQKAK